MAQVNKIVKFLSANDSNSIMKFIMIAIILVAVFSLGAMRFLDLPVIFAIAFFVIIMFISLKWANLGLYVVAFFFPFWGLEFVSGNINVPYVDLVAMALFFSLALRTLIVWFGRLEGERIKDFIYLKKFPGWKYFGVFFVISAFSVWYSPDFILGLKYFTILFWRTNIPSLAFSTTVRYFSSLSRSASSASLRSVMSN